MLPVGVVSHENKHVSEEGYVLHSYGSDAYVRHAVASVVTLRRHDTARPVALYCPPTHREELQRHGLAGMFTLIEDLPEDHRSNLGFKLHLHRFMPFERSLFVDADMVWCRNPDPLWTQLSVYPFTATGVERADFYFGGPKGLPVILDILRDRRYRTLRAFDLTYLPRVQAGMIYARDRAIVREVSDLANGFFARRAETHFRTRFLEGRSEESCEWSLAMAMSTLALPTYAWLQGHNSPQLDFVEGMTEYGENFTEVSCHYYCDRFIYDIRGIPNQRLRDFLIRLAGGVLRRRDMILVTPFVLHFSWLHAKESFHAFVQRTWVRLTESQEGPKLVVTG